MNLEDLYREALATPVGPKNVLPYSWGAFLTSQSAGHLNLRLEQERFPADASDWTQQHIDRLSELFKEIDQFFGENISNNCEENVRLLFAMSEQRDEVGWAEFFRRIMDKYPSDSDRQQKYLQGLASAYSKAVADLIAEKYNFRPSSFVIPDNMMGTDDGVINLGSNSIVVDPGDNDVKNKIINFLTEHIVMGN